MWSIWKGERRAADGGKQFQCTPEVESVCLVLFGWQFIPESIQKYDSGMSVSFMTLLCVCTYECVECVVCMLVVYVYMYYICNYVCDICVLCTCE